MFTLYSTPLSANGRKVLALCAHLGLQPRVELVDVYRGEGRSPTYLAINPTGKIPTLVEGALTLPESNAILQYVAEVHGDYRLSSRDPRERAAIARWLFWECGHWQPALAAVLAPLVGHRLLPDTVPAPTAPPDWDDPGLRPLLDQLDARLGRSPFLVGDAPSLADFSVAGMTTYFRAAAFPSQAFPGLSAWLARLEGLEAWRATAVAPWA